MKKIICLLLCTMLYSNAYAQTSKEKVLEMIKIMQADQIINQMMDQMIPMMQQQIKSSLKTEDQKQKLEKINAIIIEESKQYTKDIINGSMVTIYAKYFNTEDIDALIAFYKTDVGQKFIKLTPTITTELMQKIMQDEVPKFQQRIVNRMKEIGI
ncbi:DUF2059 domain-containing protein [Wenyingzhuangia sp. 1_MG-2023]|nr:DUF2059 domain-containing protein [Wenyingzhuangia sp. 1_MG-2023]